MVEPTTKGSLIGFGRTADIFTWGDDQILKLFHENWSGAVVEEEARIGRPVRDMGLPVPAVSGTVADGGRFGVIYERVDGPTMLKQGVVGFISLRLHLLKTRHPGLSAKEATSNSPLKST